MEILMKVGDENDNAPECPAPSSVFEVQENEQVGKTCIYVRYTYTAYACRRFNRYHICFFFPSKSVFVLLDTQVAWSDSCWFMMPMRRTQLTPCWPTSFWARLQPVHLMECSALIRHMEGSKWPNITSVGRMCRNITLRFQLQISVSSASPVAAYRLLIGWCHRNTFPSNIMSVVKDSSFHWNGQTSNINKWHLNP